MLVAAAGLHKMFSSGDRRASAYPLLPREWLDSVTLVACSRGRMQYNAVNAGRKGSCVLPECQRALHAWDFCTY